MRNEPAEPFEFKGTECSLIRRPDKAPRRSRNPDEAIPRKITDFRKSEKSNFWKSYKLFITTPHRHFRVGGNLYHERGAIVLF